MDHRESTDESMKVLLGKTPPFLVSDTDLKDVVIQPVANGLHIKLKGAVSTYRSNLYLKDGDTYTTYRVSLEQVETRPPLASGRAACFSIVPTRGMGTITHSNPHVTPRQ
jgi:hypothetical protein